MKEFQQIIKQYESNDLASFCQNYKDRTVEELESIALDFSLLYAFGDGEGSPEDLIPEQDRLVFHHWEPCTQTNFLAYLAIKIAVLRN
jgi:hypothetical protein